MKKIILSILTVILFVGCDLFSGGTPKINLTNLDSTFASGETISIAVDVSNLKQDIFALSLRIVYDPDYISFDEDQDTWIGDLWSDDVIGLIEGENNTIYISITEVAGALPFNTDGTVMTLDFTLEQSGTTLLDFVDDQLFFYDEDGNVITLSEIEIEGISITVE